MTAADAPPVTLGERLLALLVRLLARLPDALKVRLSGEPPVRVDGQRLDPMLQLLRTARRRRNPHGLAGPTLEAARRRFEREMLVHGGPKTHVWTVRDIMVDGADGLLPARHYAPPNWGGEASREEDGDVAKPLLVYFHGGGFALGSLETHDEFCRILCASGEIHVVSVAYRLAPEHPYPAALEDARAALRWARAHASEVGADVERIAVGGDDAGANLAAVVSQLEATAGTPPAAQLLVYPVVDAASAHESNALFGDGFFLDARDREAFTAWYLDGGGHDRVDPRVSPLRARSLDGLPPALVVTVGYDILRDEGREYSTRLLDAGTRVMTLHYPSLVHGFVNMTGVSPAAHDATVHVAAGFRMLLEGARSSGQRPANL